MRIAVKLVVEGFLHPGALLEAEVVDEQGWLHVPVAELREGVQFFRCEVGSEPDVVEHVLADAPDARSREIARAALSTRFAGATMMFLRSQAEGRATVDCVDGEPLSQAGAAAVALVMFAAAWDESETIVVEGGGNRHEFAVVFDETGHWVRVVAKVA